MAITVITTGVKVGRWAFTNQSARVIFLPTGPTGWVLWLASGLIWEIGSEALEIAAHNAPIDTGKYASNFELVKAVGSGVGEAWLVNRAEYAAALEWGTSEIPVGQHLLGQIADWIEGPGPQTAAGRASVDTHASLAADAAAVKEQGLSAPPSRWAPLL